MNDEMKMKFDIVFVSFDEDHASFDEYFHEMPWKARPFQGLFFSLDLFDTIAIDLDFDEIRSIPEKFDVNGIPSFVVLSSTGDIITKEGVVEVEIGEDQALSQWIEGKSLFWSREAKPSEFVWKESVCSRCYFKPIIGDKYSCANEDCRFDLCDECFGKKSSSHEHSLLESLVPK